MSKLILIPIIIIIAGAVLAFFLLSNDNPKIDSNGVIDCGSSGDINQLPRIVDKENVSLTPLFQDFYKSGFGLEEAPKLKPETLDFSLDKAIVCMDEALKDCKKARVIINQYEKGTPGGYYNVNYTFHFKYSIESEGLIYNNTYDKVGTCVVKVNLDMSSDIPNDPRNIMQPWICGTKKGGFADHSCGMYETCSWKKSVGANIHGLIEDIKIESLFLFGGEGDPEYCTLDYPSTQDSPTIKCEDTDGGRNIYAKGTVSLVEGGNTFGPSFTDTCLSETQIDEGDCLNIENAAATGTFTLECPTDYTCSDGACIKKDY